MAFLFTWDPNKAESNKRRHGVSFEDALTAFSDPLARIFSDGYHSEEEEREILVGHAVDRQLLVISFTERGPMVRLISARVATSKERRDYEQGTSRLS